MAARSHLRLACGALSLKLAPATGGSIARFDCTLPDGGKMPVLRSIGRGAGGRILDQASFPLVPFVNRVRGRRFAFRGREIVLTPNLEGDPSPLHGFGWTAPWEVESLADTEAVLALRYSPGEWPWHFYAAQHFALDGRGLTVTLTCTNEAAEPMPCGLGLHPYFPCTPETILDADVACAWTIDADTLPVDKVPAADRYSLRNRRICGAGLDNGFGGWAGVARLSDPARPFDVTLSSPEASFLHVYAPLEGRFVALEPVSHANAALGEPEQAWAALGLRVLVSGETMHLSMRVAVEPR